MSARERKFLVGGNWKMNGTKSTIDGILRSLRDNQLSSETEVIVAPPSCYLSYVKDSAPDGVSVSAQNCYKVLKGAYTGEISVEMLADLGIEWTIIGHSERRNVFGESNELIGDKVQFAVANSMNVIVCIGENLSERQAGRTEEVVAMQLKAISDKISNWSPVVIAYEPVWAIGTGLSATPEQAQSVHIFLRKSLREISDTVASQTRIIYGGSVNAANCQALAAMPDIDGFLVGGASLKPEFIDIINSNC